ncbi:MotA/TolQ/ExbB proton channel family protein, partial [Planctomycetota bacterium]
MAESKNKKFSFCRLIGLAGATFLIVGAIAVGAGAAMFINLPSLAITFGITFFMLLAAFGKDFLKFIPDSLATLICTPQEANPRFAEIAAHGARYVIGAGVIGTMIGIIQMLSNLSDPSGIGAGMATALLTIFYAVITSELLFAYLHKAYSDGNKTETTKPLPASNIALPGIVTSILIIAFLIMLCYEAIPQVQNNFFLTFL